MSENVRVGCEVVVMDGTLAPLFSERFRQLSNGPSDRGTTPPGRPATSRRAPCPSQGTNGACYRRRRAYNSDRCANSSHSTLMVCGR
jgi:hypothetical protein